MGIAQALLGGLDADIEVVVLDLHHVPFVEIQRTVSTEVTWL